MKKFYPEILTGLLLALAVSSAMAQEKAGADVKSINDLETMGREAENQDKKLEAFQKALSLCEKTTSCTLGPRLQISIGGVYLDAGELDASWDWAARGMSAAEAAKDRLQVARALNLFGLIEEIRGNYLASLDSHEKALAIRRELNNQAGIAGSINNIGLVYLDLSNYSSAAKTFEESIALSEKSSDDYNLALSLLNLGNVYLITGNYAKAMTVYQRSLEIELRRGGDGGQQIINIGMIYESQGDFDQARTYFNRSLSLSEKAGNSAEIANNLVSLGRIEHSVGNLRQALELETRALAIDRQIGFRVEVANTLDSMSRVYSELGDFENAASAIKDALEIAQELGDPKTIFQVLLDKAGIQILQGRYDAAIETANSAESYFEKTGGSYREWEVYATLARANRGSGRNVQAKADLDKAISVIESQRLKVAGGSEEVQETFGLMTSPYAQMADVLVAEHQDTSAWGFVERAKARTLLDSLQTGKMDISRAMTAVEKATEQKLKDELISINAKLSLLDQDKNSTAEREEFEKQRAQKRSQFRDFQVQLYSKHPELGVNRGEMRSIRLDELSVLLPDISSASLEFLVGDDKTYAFVITKDSVGKPSLKAYPIAIKQKDLVVRIEKYQSALAAGGLDIRNQARELYDLLLMPAQAQLTGKTNLIVVPDGPLWNLPFQALMDEKGKYLAERMAVSYAPSLTALREMQKKAKERKPSKDAELVAFGNPTVNKETAARVGRVFMDEKLEPLPEAERLVNTLAKMYGPQRSKVYTGAAAREETAKQEAPKYRIVQFATHGILNDVSPMYSHLVLAQDEKNPNEDGLLEAWELKDLDLKADMVILSACDTARGRVSAGEGMIGMTWAAFIAGAPTTVASQWKVESSSTTELMLEFHRQLLTGKVSKAEALRRAQLKLMKNPKYRHPSYWAGWVIVGDAS